MAKIKKRSIRILLYCLTALLLFVIPIICHGDTAAFSMDQVPPYAGVAWVDINDSVPFFTEEEMRTDEFVVYGELDDLGRCTAAYGCLGRSLMPTEPRGDISELHPTGWHQAKYGDELLFNRCHLIGFQLTGQNTNECNLITGTRYMNVEGMLENENSVADYIRETGNHVMYRVTPIFEGDNLLASGVLMEAKSVEDPYVEYCQFCYNVQPGVILDYATGYSRAEQDNADDEEHTYVLNTSSKKFHFPECDSVDEMKEKNKKEVHCSRNSLIKDGYEPCGRCNP